MENIFAGYPNRYVILTGQFFAWREEVELCPFDNAPDLKELWINPSEFDVTSASFAKVAGELNVYFYNHTYEEIIAMEKNDKFITGASELVHFYFKDTMPEDVQWPPELQPED